MGIVPGSHRVQAYCGIAATAHVLSSGNMAMAHSGQQHNKLLAGVHKAVTQRLLMLAACTQC